MNSNMHGIKSVDTYVWPKTTYTPSIYASFKLIELSKGRGELTVFIDTLEELDKVLDALNTLRREFAEALEEDAIREAVPNE